MMKIVLIAAFVALAASAAVDSDREARTLGSHQDDSALPEGRFSYGFATSNGIAQQAVGQIKNPEAAPEDQIQEVRGSYSYVDANGNTVAVNYIADENGFNVVPASPVIIPAPVAAPVVPRVAPIVVKTPVVKTTGVAPVVVPQSYFGGLNAYNPYLYNPYFNNYNNVNRFGYLGNPYTNLQYPYAYQGGLGSPVGLGSQYVLPAGANRGGLRVINQQGNVVQVL